MNTCGPDKIRKYKVSILDKNYFLVSDESEVHLKDAVQLVDDCLRQMIKKSSEPDIKHNVILVALQLASKTLKAQELLDKHGQHCDKLLNLINREFLSYTTLENSHCKL